ncbi:hypothetical protein BAOM_3133 [Peribacillus asahii]|uniref:DUF5659 domain-containing protein n=1 Tax=Peribacillus asahii TaxID=228899 RepID=A0A3Q9RNG6_9BACI|nr:DUF5659 domain-containing protein [Peribacillus asahii]AZV43742.1 hypothetical protein BAOM_3133 [Peribacillus asahii]
MVIYSQKLMAKLVLKGFVLQGMGKNSNDKHKNVFYFKDSEELRKAMDELKQ